MAVSSSSAPEANVTVRRGSSLYLWGSVLAVGSIPAYLLLIDVPLLRATALQSFALMVAGVGVSFLAYHRDRRRRAGVAALGNLAFLVLGTALFLVGARLPRPGRAPETQDRIVDFTLPDPSGQPVRLSSLYERGPTLLVFYRGHW